MKKLDFIPSKDDKIAAGTIVKDEELGWRVSIYKGAGNKYKTFKARKII